MSDSPRKFQGVWIPAERWLDRSLSPNEKVMLGEISSLDTGPRGCYATNAHFAEFFNLSISRVSEIISGLADRGLIRVELIREGKRIVERRIRLSTPFEIPNTPSENASNPFVKNCEPPSENTQGNNTSLNNTLSNQNPMADGLNKQDMSIEFDLFWKLYPRKVKKPSAERAWKKQKIKADDFNQILGSLAYWVTSTEWKKSGGQFIPYPATWLNDRQWEDEVPASGGTQSRQTGLDKIDHTAGLELDDNGNYRIAGSAQ